MLPALSVSVSKSDHSWILSLTWQRIYTLLSSEEWFCIRSLQGTRYTDPGDIWRKLKLRGEDTGSVTPTTSSDGKSEEESRLNVSIPSFFSTFHLIIFAFYFAPKYNWIIINHYYYHWQTLPSFRGLFWGQRFLNIRCLLLMLLNFCALSSSVTVAGVPYTVIARV